MTSTITAANLTLTIKESIELNGIEQGATNTKTITGVNEVSKRIVTVTTTEAEILAFGTSVASGQFIEGDVRYIRFTNLDDTNHIVLTFKNEDNDEFAIKLDAGHSFVYPGDNAGGVVDTMDAIDGTGITLSLGDLVNVTADADTSSCDMEIFVASV